MEISHEHVVDSFDATILAGMESLKSNDLTNAKKLFLRAHTAGHGDIDDHIRSHLSLLAVAWRERNVGECISNFFSVVVLRLAGAFWQRAARRN